jgi:hypothetical protein
VNRNLASNREVSSPSFLEEGFPGIESRGVESEFLRGRLSLAPNREASSPSFLEEGFEESLHRVGSVWAFEGS